MTHCREYNGANGKTITHLIHTGEIIDPFAFSPVCSATTYLMAKRNAIANDDAFNDDRIP